MAMDKLVGKAGIRRVTGPEVTEGEEPVAIEEPLEIRVAGRSVAVVMRTPGHDRELAAGFLFTEGLIRRRDDVLDLVACTGTDAPAGNRIDVLLAPEVEIDFARLSRHVFTSSSCGICSKATIEAVLQERPRLERALRPRRAVIAMLPDRLREAQPAFALTGAVHASGLFDAAGEMVLVREDVGRHNALDKVIGHAFLAEQLPLSEEILMVSGRVSFEIMQKALAAGIGCVAAVSAPTSAAIEFAQRGGQTLIGFVRGERMNVYAGTFGD